MSGFDPNSKTKMVIEGTTVADIMKQLAHAGLSMGEAVQMDLVATPALESLFSKIEAIADRMETLLTVAAGTNDAVHGRVENARKATRQPGRFEDLKQAIREGYEISKTSGAPQDDLMEALKAVVDEFMEHEDRMEAQGRQLDDLARRVADLKRDRDDSAHEHVLCEHEPASFEYISYEYDEDGNQSKANKSEQFLVSWGSDQSERPSYSYTFGGKPVKEGIKVLLCRKCKLLYVEVDGVIQ